jgi:maleylacetoacetate isomerase
MKLVLHDYWRSSASYRVRIALNLKGIDYEARPVNLVAGEQRNAANLARNPQGLVPTLEVDGVAIPQSLAILDWLDATFPEPRLIPVDPLARAAGWGRALVVAGVKHPNDHLRGLKRLESQFGADQDAKGEWYRHWIVEGLTALEAMAGDDPFLGGGAPDISDVCLVPQLYNARRFEVALDAFPKLLRADAAMAEIDAVAAAHPDRARPPAVG